MDEYVEISHERETYLAPSDQINSAFLGMLFKKNCEFSIVINQENNQVVRKEGNNYIVTNGGKYRVIFNDEPSSSSGRT
jgi:hypothetical protein